MNADVALAFCKLLGTFDPGWALILLVVGILSYRSPQLVREIFVGIRGAKKSRNSRG
jgi:hypothetical protein